MPKLGERRYQFPAVGLADVALLPEWPAGPLIMEQWNGEAWVAVPDPTPVVPPDPASTVNACSVSPAWNFWNWLGFGYAFSRVPDALAEAEGWAPGCNVMSTMIAVDWKDRLRVLVSGKAMVQISTQMDVMPGRMRSWSDFRVLPPSYKFAKPTE